LYYESWCESRSKKIEKVAKEFFNKPTNFKTAFNNENQKLLDTGYFPAKLDGKEGFDILHHGFKWENKDDITETKLPSDNEVTDFSSTINKYADEMCELAKVLLHAISRAYRYAPAEISAFDKIMDQHKSTIRLNYYPKMSETKKTSPIDGSFLACPEHYDSGLLTILSQDMVGGLQGIKKYLKTVLLKILIKNQLSFDTVFVQNKPIFKSSTAT